MTSLSFTTPTPKPTSIIPSKPQQVTINASVSFNSFSRGFLGRREVIISVAASGILFSFAPAPGQAFAAAEVDDEYVKETAEVINKMRSTVNMDKKDPSVTSAVAELRQASNTWVAKYRREKSLLGRASFRDVYSAINAVSGHYINFGPTAPIPAKRKARILEEIDTAEKALLRGR
ncbi:photosystem II repair protein PSB27-H1, chloroplastic [Phalaenopsis equestris]|uniref:photosystem II repair protein PSB27-H1, chloroplastic n=1 Tax=Phalaenopsis equestris TaxID=78828 RepID=UPI0009E4E17E|nr:photosystem II repair protein PSB27-H1, chloroplastic [Phalaenopsis equestris]